MWHNRFDRSRASPRRRQSALAETINGLYKTEVITPRKPWRTVEQVELATAERIHWYNHRRQPPSGR
jgi:transposase InsO family protein